ncbi:hypothetical protein [Herbidospora yilanensis]|uniref:hypothetical protein n=1 Tax=Herbidospora yilanensis TaxID=354426 RepID=UPI000784A0BA|nr:hypothetical protein [Herbidospora yilanensis]
MKSRTRRAVIAAVMAAGISGIGLGVTTPAYAAPTAATAGPPHDYPRIYKGYPTQFACVLNKTVLSSQYGWYQSWCEYNWNSPEDSDYWLWYVEK